MMVVARPWCRLAFALTITITIIAAAAAAQELFEEDADDAEEEEEADPNDEFKNSESLPVISTCVACYLLPV